MICDENLEDMNARGLKARSGEVEPCRVATLGEDIISLVHEVRRLRSAGLETNLRLQALMGQLEVDLSKARDGANLRLQRAEYDAKRYATRVRLLENRIRHAGETLAGQFKTPELDEIRKVRDLEELPKLADVPEAPDEDDQPMKRAELIRRVGERLSIFHGSDELRPGDVPHLDSERIMKAGSLRTPKLSWNDPKLQHDPNYGRICLICKGAVPTGHKFNHGRGICYP